MDWMSWTIELIGIAIVCFWIVVPVMEFKEIFRKLRGRIVEPNEQAPTNPEKQP